MIGPGETGRTDGCDGLLPYRGKLCAGLSMRLVHQADGEQGNSTYFGCQSLDEAQVLLGACRIDSDLAACSVVADIAVIVGIKYGVDVGRVVGLDDRGDIARVCSVERSEWRRLQPGDPKRQPHDGDVLPLHVGRVGHRIIGVRDVTAAHFQSRQIDTEQRRRCSCRHGQHHRERKSGGSSFFGAHAGSFASGWTATRINPPLNRVIHGC